MSRRMGRQPCCDNGVKKGAWTPEEDKILVDYIAKNGHGTWRSIQRPWCFCSYYNYA